ncbi:hypothetical protein M422DRAFT_53142 [Sphaerobolus stellatus SS14]|uniref:Uncharacterized protein n=1 Tax=Sphaerobolus stellatus (strain SS14) TaxID=990650 RepID=A0A0C9TPN7_SPHS4|nr:hypothetical protein M422DRAFT_53142 [Sphaerobolus stellatus SS14]
MTYGQTTWSKFGEKSPLPIMRVLTNASPPTCMSRRSGFAHQAAPTGSSKGVVTTQIGRRRRREANNEVPYPSGKRYIANNELDNERKLQHDIRRAELAELPSQTRRAAEQMERSLQMPQSIDTEIFDCGPDNDWEDVPMSAGDQLADLELSHEGMELEGYIESIRDYAKGRHRRKYKPGGLTHWQMRTSRRREEWEAQIHLLYKSYIQYTYGKSQKNQHNTMDSDSDSDSGARGDPRAFQIAVLGLNGYDTARTIAHDKHGNPYLNQTLIDNGFLGSSPIQPSLAFALKDLEIYRRYTQLAHKELLPGMFVYACWRNSTLPIRYRRH